MLIVYVCQEFKWDYTTYINQPQWFLDLIHKKMEIDGIKQKNEESKSKIGKK